MATKSRSSRSKSSASRKRSSSSSNKSRKSSGRKYGTKAQNKISEVMHEFGEGKLRSGSSGKKITNRKQAVAIGISEARREGDKVPSRKRAA
ncbi:MAG: DUF6496 domain-containing protein [Terriglobales bacterium]|jgi:hypothetical protein